MDGDKIMTVPLVSGEEAAEIALERKQAPDMITVEEFRARYGCEPSMTINISEAARNLADAWDKRVAEMVYKDLGFKR